MSGFLPVLIRSAGRVCAIGSLLFAIAGCGSLGLDSSLGAAQIRFVQVSSAGLNLDVYVNGTGAAYSLGFASYSSYLPVNPGSTNLSVTKAGSAQPVAQTQGALAGGHQYTAVVSRGLGNLQERVYADQDIPAPQGTSELRVLNEVEGAPGINIYVVPAGSGTASAVPASVFMVASGAESAYASMPASGSYTVTATIAEGALNLPVASVSMKGASGAVRTVVFAGSVQPGAHSVVGFGLEDVSLP